MTIKGLKGFPHASGDVPRTAASAQDSGMLSPREWGCSACQDLDGLRLGAFPTRVGMFRRCGSLFG